MAANTKRNAVHMFDGGIGVSVSVHKRSAFDHFHSALLFRFL